MASIPLENDIEFNEMEQQQTYKNEGILFFFLSDHQQEMILHGIEEFFASMLKSVEKHKFTQFIECGYEFLLNF